VGLLDLVDRSWPVLRRVTGAHTAVYRLSRGLIGHRVPCGPPMLLLDHVGARSGTLRTTPLVYGIDGDALVLVASKGGNPRHPAWYHNLVAHPDTQVQVGGKRGAVHARVAEADERPRLWRTMVGVYPGFETYRLRTAREIPLIVLEPR
jgi:deazaflavin-dependent oxidoreductase (nitroreductase family)